MAGDRISEAYEGKINENAQQSSKMRIDWFSRCIKGEDILDIGCSQGILPILLGRKGKKVVGIDNDYESIDYAINSLEKEEKYVRENVSFICDDFIQRDFNGHKFDTIVLGEVLEHLFNPMLVLEKAAMLLKDDGLIIVSVPFGINRHPDHKRTYYFIELYNQVDKHFCVENVNFMGKWIAMLATSKSNANKQKLDINSTILMRFEEAVYNLDEIREGEKNEIKNKLAQSYENTKKLKAEINTTNEIFKKSIRKLENENKGLEEKNKGLEEKNKGLEEKNKGLEEKNKGLEEKNKDYFNKVEAWNNKLISREKKIKESINQIKKLERKYLDLSNSKLGSIQVEYWKIKSKRKKRRVFTKLKYKIKEIAKKSPLLCNLVWRYRNKKANSQEITKKYDEYKKTGEEESIKLNAKQRRMEYEEKTDKDFFLSIKDIIEKIPESNGGRYYKKHNYKIGIIADEFLYSSFKDAADFIFITPDNWKEAVSETQFLLVVSTWRGLNDEWRGLAQEGSEKRELVYQIIKKYNEDKKPTVFYSKEDPPNYKSFVSIAQKCEYIFTTCAEVVEDYKRDCNNDNVEVLCFGINPLYHNPVGFRNQYKKEGVIFSGSWMTKYPERLKDMRMLFDGVLEGGKSLKIIDRNYFYLTSEIYRYPKEYWSYISPAISHDELQKVHKLYNWALNINTVTESMTMFANRGYELQAAGNLLISNYSPGINNKLPMVYTVTDKSEIGSIINGYSEEELYNKQIASIRSVMTNETAFDRVGQIIEAIGYEKNENKRGILVVADSINDNIEAMFKSQSYPYKELIGIDDLTYEKYAESDMITFFSESMEYDMFYLEDMSNGFKYTNCDYITKDAYYEGENFVNGLEHNYISLMKNKYCTVFWSSEFSLEQLIAFEGEEEISNGYSIDHFNFSLKRRNCRKKEDFKMSVIVPVYNNGRQLLGKAFSSLQRSSMFNDMEILLIDDGSTDGYTDKLVKHLDKKYENVKAFFFADGGSGSASRPRNKGVELASAEYVTYLDPDNEAIFDGYAKLYELSIDKNYDITVGNMLKLTTEVLDAKYYKNFHEKYGSDIIDNDTKNYMLKTNFSPMSIQAMVIKKSIITENNITQPIGAAGQDTLFCWELFFNAKTIKAINLPIHIYYAAVEGSTVNNIGKRFFEKYYLIEQPRKKALEKYGVLEMYMKLRYNYYFTNWVLKKLSMVKEENAEECAKLVYDMHKIYEDVYLNDGNLINEFVKACESNSFKNAYKFIKKSLNRGA